jgi:hypothetical protein
MHVLWSGISKRVNPTASGLTDRSFASWTGVVWCVDASRGIVAKCPSGDGFTICVRGLRFGLENRC